MSARFAVGDRVRVANAFPPGHVRTPAFLRGQKGVVVRHFGAFGNPERLAYGMNGRPLLPLYQVLFRMQEVWQGDGNYGANDTVAADIFEPWLEPAVRED